MSDTTEEFINRGLTNLFRLALYRWNIKITCLTCNHFRIFQGHQLWWLYHRRAFSDHVRDFPKRLYCSRCLTVSGKRRRTLRWEKTREEPSGPSLPWPDEAEWKRMLRRYRS